jgi:hypothetical protein
MISLRVSDIVAGVLRSSVGSPNRMFRAQEKQMGKREPGKLLKKDFKGRDDEEGREKLRADRASR